MEMWVLKALPNSHDPFDRGFYTGKSYIYQSAKYAVVDKDIKSAKPYTTYPKAVAACKKMCFENYSFEVVRQSDFEIQKAGIDYCRFCRSVNLFDTQDGTVCNECGTIQ